MVDSIFVLKVLIAFIIGSAWMTGSTILAEKFGPKIGGLMGGIPCVTVIALFFIGWTQTSLIASKSTVLIPITIGIDGLFIATYACLVKHSFILAILCSMLVWVLLSLSLVIIQFHNFLISLVSWVILSFVSYVVMEYVLKVRSIYGQTYTFSFSNVVLRAIISGSTITLSVVLAKLGGPLVGGVFSSFPAVILSIMIITYFAQGSAFTLSVLKILMISISINATVYALAVRFLYPLFGLIAGTVSSFLLSLVSSYFVFLLVKKCS